MNTNIKEVRDTKSRNKLAGIHYPEAVVIEIKLFGCRLMRIKFPPNTPVELSFCDSDKTREAEA